jgi:hypothetical protein
MATASPVFVVPMSGLSEEEKRQYDRWNVEGNVLYHQTREKDQVKYCVANLPQLTEPYPFKVGFTGYVQLYTIPKTKFGQAVDENNRRVFIVGDYLIFQRFTQGNVYVYTKIGETSYQAVTEEQWDEFVGIIKTMFH